MPFDTPEELKGHFTELVENNLSLMNQWQENEEMTESKRNEQVRIEGIANKEIA